jgi:hypothetical protein
MARPTRTDPHRPGAIIPAHYDYVMSYSLATSSGGWPIPSWGVNCELDRRVTDKDGKLIKNGEHNADGMCCIIGMLHVAKVPFVATGGTGKCSVCGACYVYGDVWRHTLTGEYLHLGHDCADKYQMLADRSAYMLELGRLKDAAAKECAKAQKAEELKEFIDSNPGLETALKFEHPITRDLAEKLQIHRNLSPAQVALAIKLATEVPEKKVPAPEGRVTFTGKVVSVKTVEGFNGGAQLKMTVKVTTPDGIWLANGTAPAGILGEVTQAARKDTAVSPSAKGCDVEITATLKPGNDPSFAFMSRPNGKVVHFAPKA